ncbi:hypothetical protein ETAA8_16990 [Anatilimnocola aggregata]|uniref:Integrase n=1 Tax=Anatilimnocola aggregata TaxID=2528021 RepID=A0A517Y8P4_9BACT|nr:hypothetical protein ETAA8_16990 [Anatilimnocola aggregata]
MSFGETHMDHVCGENLEHYDKERPHQGIENEFVNDPRRRSVTQPVESIPMCEIRSSARLGWLLKCDWRKSA